MDNNQNRTITVTVNKGYQEQKAQQNVNPIPQGNGAPNSAPNSAPPARPKQKKKIKLGGIAAALIIAAETIALCLCTSRLNQYKDAFEKDEEYITAQSSRVFNYMGSKDKITFNDPTYGDVWLQAVTDFPRNPYDFSRIRSENGIKNYYEDGENLRLTKSGIDVSYHQGYIDWNKVKASGIDFVMLRAGYRGYETGTVTIDDMFHSYARDASAAGLDVGVYFYSQALTVPEAEEEASVVLDAIRDYNITYPVVFDWEIVGEPTARTNKISAQALNDCAYAFCNKIAEEGYIPMIYSVQKMALMKYDLSRLSGFDFWLAQYKDTPEFPYEMQMWQYASDGHVDGIEGEVDLNMSFVDYAQIRQNHLNPEE